MPPHAVLIRRCRFGAALMVCVACLGAGAGVAAARSPWTAITYPRALAPGTMLLLTDGSVMVQNQGPNNNGASSWWLLSPSATGSYAAGTWKRIASMPRGYGPVDYASAVLPDGRVIVEGGEDNLGHDGIDTALGAIYDPVANTWTPVAAPVGSVWSSIGDAPGVVLPDGTFMMGGAGGYLNTGDALLDPENLSWTLTGSDRVEDNEESGFTLLPNGTVLSVGVFPTANLAEVYTPATGDWSSAGTTPDDVVDTAAGEIGPAPLLPDGDVLVVGGTGQNALYDPADGTWSTAPSLPDIAGMQFGVDDGPAAVLPDGNVMIDASPGAYRPPEQFFLYNGRTMSLMPDPPDTRHDASYNGRLLDLPNGQVLFNDRFETMAVYTPAGRPQASWRPRVTQVPTELTPGGAYPLQGDQLNGLTDGAYYGDDAQDATNYPIVRLVYPASGRVVFARSSGMTSMSVTPGQVSQTTFQLPPSAPRGTARLVVSANGISSAPVTVTVG